MPPANAQQPPPYNPQAEDDEEDEIDASRKTAFRLSWLQIFFILVAVIMTIVELTYVLQDRGVSHQAVQIAQATYGTAHSANTIAQAADDIARAANGTASQALRITGQVTNLTGQTDQLGAEVRDLKAGLANLTTTVAYQTNQLGADVRDLRGGLANLTAVINGLQNKVAYLETVATSNRGGGYSYLSPHVWMMMVAVLVLLLQRV